MYVYASIQELLSLGTCMWYLNGYVVSLTFVTGDLSSPQSPTRCETTDPVQHLVCTILTSCGIQHCQSS